MFNKSAKYFVFLTLIIIAISLCSYTIYTYTKTQITVPKFSRSSWIGDYDLDGDNDIIVGHCARGLTPPTDITITTLNNIDGFNFSIVDTSQIFVGGQYDIFATDMDNNGTPDLITNCFIANDGIEYNYVRIFYSINDNYQTYREFTNYIYFLL